MHSMEEEDGAAPHEPPRRIADSLPLLPPSLPRSRTGPDDPIAHIISAMTAGASGTIATNPLWVIKTRFMTQQVTADEKRYRHTWDAFARIYREEGFKAFYRGMIPSLFGVVHVAVQFPLYEQFKVMSRASPLSLPLPPRPARSLRRHGR